MWVKATTLLSTHKIPRKLIVAEMIQPDQMSMMDMRDMRQSTRRAYRDQFRDFLEHQPPHRRKVYRDQMKQAATAEERIGIVEKVLFENSTSESWDLRATFSALEFATARECAQALSERFLGGRLSKRQNNLLANALSTGQNSDAALTVENLTLQRMSGTLHLLFSMAEYHLC